MEKDNTQYFNDEWNLTKDQLLIKSFGKVYDIVKNKLEILIKEEFIKQGSNGITTLPKEFNNYRQLSCQCNLPRPNSFTGNCTSCNKIIKPIIDRNADKYTK